MLGGNWAHKSQLHQVGTVESVVDANLNAIQKTCEVVNNLSKSVCEVDWKTKNVLELGVTG